MSTKQKIYPTCNLCDKLNADMTHCAIYGPVSLAETNNTAIGAACTKSGDYVRLLHAVPNDFNYGFTSDGKTIDEAADEELLVYDAGKELDGFKLKHGLTLQEWAEQAFSERKRD
ncbi:hypothetical protein Q0V21_31070 [Paenibacillus sp. 11B]|uniref:hypothetical protein n=1 Tax=unclassified Paenibacillus TaxID=185978 RepID=UPI000CF9BCDA|nr:MULTISPECIES: hypothetical protein [unclassified Paenibacillus]MDN8593173.1 hypothetical protein [Paenibacillus sp. 11B]PQP80291.1 hypothetical protein C0Q44_28165 [Paenibacillus sp. PCH8]